MPNFVSKDGVWEPAHEYVVDPKAPKGQEIYEGPDRAAVELLKNEGVDHLGQHFSMDPEMVMRAKQFGYNTVQEYVEARGYTTAKAESAYQAKKAETVTHADPARKPFKKPEKWGGQDVSGQGKHRDGGFEHPADAPGTKPNG